MKQNTQFACYVTDADDYVFVPLQQLDGQYVAGVNVAYPVYIADGPGLRRLVQRMTVRHEFEKRIEAGDNLYPQPQRPRRSFGINYKGMFNFGETRVVHNYDNCANIHPDDELSVDIMAYIDPHGINTSALNVML